MNSSVSFAATTVINRGEASDLSRRRRGTIRKRGGSDEVGYDWGNYDVC